MIVQNIPGIAAMLYIIFFQSKEIASKREENTALRLENEKLRMENDKLHMKNEQTLMRVIAHLEAPQGGKARPRISRIPPDTVGAEDHV